MSKIKQNNEIIDFNVIISLLAKINWGNLSPKNNFFNIANNETYLSAIIAYSLSKDQTHEQGSKYFQLLLEECGISSNYYEEDYSVYTEYSISPQTEDNLNTGRIDILIESKNYNHAIVIENKPYATDGSEQIKRYSNFAEKKYKDGYIIIYLPMTDKNPVPTSISSDELKKLKEKKKYFCLPYFSVDAGKSLVSWIDKCCKANCQRDLSTNFLNELKEWINMYNENNKTDIINKVEMNFNNLNKEDQKKIINFANISGFETLKNRLFKQLFSDQIKKMLPDYKEISITEDVKKISIFSLRWNIFIQYSFKDDFFAYGIAEKYLNKARIEDPLNIEIVKYMCDDSTFSEHSWFIVWKQKVLKYKSIVEWYNQLIDDPNVIIDEVILGFHEVSKKIIHAEHRLLEVLEKKK